jgi:hypothetical protein
VIIAAVFPLQTQRSSQFVFTDNFLFKENPFSRDLNELQLFKELCDLAVVVVVVVAKEVDQSQRTDHSGQR